MAKKKTRSTRPAKTPAKAAKAEKAKEPVKEPVKREPKAPKAQVSEWAARVKRAAQASFPDPQGYRDEIVRLLGVTPERLELWLKGDEMPDKAKLGTLRQLAEKVGPPRGLAPPIPAPTPPAEELSPKRRDELKAEMLELQEMTSTKCWARLVSSVQRKVAALTSSLLEVKSVADLRHIQGEVQGAEWVLEHALAPAVETKDLTLFAPAIKVDAKRFTVIVSSEAKA